MNILLEDAVHDWWSKRDSKSQELVESAFDPVNDMESSEAWSLAGEPTDSVADVLMEWSIGWVRAEKLLSDLGAAEQNANVAAARAWQAAENGEPEILSELNTVLLSGTLVIIGQSTVEPSLRGYSMENSRPTGSTHKAMSCSPRVCKVESGSSRIVVRVNLCGPELPHRPPP